MTVIRYKAVFFDFDYTLGDATGCIVAGFCHAFQCMGLPQPDYEAVRGTIGMPLENAYTLLSGDGDPEHQARFRRFYVEKANPLQVTGTRLFPGAVELLDWLREESILAAIVSTKRRGVIEDILAYQGLSDRVAFCVGGNDTPHYKPAPDGALLALSKAGIRASEALFVGDTVIDAETAQRAGLDFAAVCNGTTPASAFADWPHVHVAPDLPELHGFLKSLKLEKK